MPTVSRDHPVPTQAPSNFGFWPGGCRNVVLQQVGSYPGYSGRDGNAFGKAARDPNATSSHILAGCNFSLVTDRKVVVLWGIARSGSQGRTCNGASSSRFSAPRPLRC